MDLRQKIETDLTVAIKSRNQAIVSVLRMLKSSIKNLEIEKKQPLNDIEVIGVIEKQAKQRQDSIEQYVKGSRDDLAKKEEEELRIIMAYLPAKLSAEETRALIDTVIKELGASSLKDMSPVMKEIALRGNGQIEGKMASELVREKLS